MGGVFMASSEPDMRIPRSSSATAVTDRVAERRDAPVAAVPAETAAPSPEPIGARPSVPPAGLGVLGVLTALVGAWGAVVAFVGPSFGFSGDGSVSWYWSFPHAMLWVVPGAVATLCGLSMLRLVPRAFAGLGRIGSGVIGLIVAACGAWFVVGYLAWPVLRNSAGVFVPSSPIRELAYQIGYSVGPGLLLAVFGGFAMGWAVRSRSRRSHRSHRSRREVVSAAAAPAPDLAPADAVG
jgi:hypothetical protein